MIYSCPCRHMAFPVFPMTTDKSVKTSVFSHTLQVSIQEQNPVQSVLKVFWADGFLPCLPGSSITASTLDADAHASFWCLARCALAPAPIGFGVSWFNWIEEHWQSRNDSFFSCLDLLFIIKKQACIPIFFFHDSGSHIHASAFPSD